MMHRMFFSIVILFAAAELSALQARVLIAQPRFFQFDIDPKTPLAELLPTPPKLPPGPGITNDLAQVPEVTFGAPLQEKDVEKAMAHVLAKINHLNKKNPDGFMEALLANRADLRGLPFRMGKDCRTEGAPASLFAEVVHLLHHSFSTELDAMIEKHKREIEPHQAAWAKIFFLRLQKSLADKKGLVDSRLHKASAAEVHRATIAVLMQMLIAEDESKEHRSILRAAPRRVELAAFLATIEEPEAGRALAQLALFAPEDTVRAAATDALKTRQKRDYLDTLTQGFRYPLRDIPHRAAEAIIKIGARDAVPELVKVLDQSDPRAPMKQVIDGKDATVVREVVRVRHHRNCILCHAPAVRGVPNSGLVAPVSLPGEPIRNGYGFMASPDIFVRVDVTYLRQDFSQRMLIHDENDVRAGSQRFDFFVRTRVVTSAEAVNIRKALEPSLDTHRRAADRSLRALTGRSAPAATGKAWQTLLAQAPRER